MSSFPGRLVICVLSTVAYFDSAVASDRINLLQLLQVSLEHRAGSDNHKELTAVTDGEPSTISSIAPLSEDEPVTIIYGFEGLTVSLEKLIITLPEAKSGVELPNQVDLLVSTLSPNAGYHSVRTDPLQSVTKPQEFSFSAVGAKWIMLRLTPAKKGATIAIAEIAILGNEGPPVTRYQFKESPTSAFEVLRKLEKNTSLNVSTISKDELSLFEDAKDGKLDQWSFGEAALLASGVVDSRKRKEYVSRLDKLEAQAKAVVSKAKTTIGKGQALLKFLHEGPLAKGYVAQQTDLAGILDSGTYNCVSSATLYNVIGRRLGLDCRGIEVPHHAFSILYDGTNHSDVETTTAGGFNPSRNPAARDEFTKLTGFAYIPESNRDERREVDEVGLLAITYYNHAVSLTDEKKYHAALLAFFRAMSLDSEFDSAIKGALGVLAKWSVTLTSDKQFEEALNVLSTGLELAPKDAMLINNRRAVWEQWADDLIKGGKSDEALSVLRRAEKAIPDANFHKMQSWVYIRSGEELVKAKEWEKAMAVVEPGLDKLDPAPRHDLEEWRENLYFRWAQDELKSGRFDAAAGVITGALKLKPAEKKLTNQLAFILQEWLRDAYSKQSTDELEKLITDLSARFCVYESVPKVIEATTQHALRDMAEKGQYEEAIGLADHVGRLSKDRNSSVELASVVYDRWASNLSGRKEWQKAIDVYDMALKRFPKNGHLEQNLKATWYMWAEGYLQAKDWAGAIDVYEKELKQHPNLNQAKNNIPFVAQEWAKDAYEKDGETVALMVITNQVKRFPEIKDLKEVAQNHVRLVVQNLVQQAKYDMALSAIESGKTLLGDEQETTSLIVSVYSSRADTHIQKKEWPGALDVYRAGIKKFPNNDLLQKNRDATWNMWAGSFINAKEWSGALDVYEKALKEVPDTKNVENNIIFCVQEWNANAYANGGEKASEEVLNKQFLRFPEIKGLQSVATRHLEKIVRSMAQNEKFDDALAAIERGKKLIKNDDEARKNVEFVYDNWANVFVKKKEWQSAVDIYEKGLKKNPKNAHLENNAIATWYEWAETYSKDKDWSGAIGVYEKALVKFPDNGTFKNNIEFCKQQKEKK